MNLYLSLCGALNVSLYQMTRFTKVPLLYRLICAAVLLVLVALGLGSKAYSGWGQGWIHDFSGDVLYEMFWIWLVGGWQLRWRVERIAIATFIITAIIEVSQLIAFPAAWQTQLWWRLLLGTSFSWPDFPCYAAGALLGAISLTWLRNRLNLNLKQSHYTGIS
jgi:hypothetical protein